MVLVRAQGRLVETDFFDGEEFIYLRHAVSDLVEVFLI